jgi:hypothetical protein
MFRLLKKVIFPAFYMYFAYWKEKARYVSPIYIYIGLLPVELTVITLLPPFQIINLSGFSKHIAFYCCKEKAR